MESTYSAKYEELRARTKHFALRIVTLFRSLPRNEEARIIGKQVLRSGTSVGANYRAACRARSRADFVSKVGIVLEEADETAYWLELLIDGGIVAEGRLVSLMDECNELVRIFASSLHTAKERDTRAAKRQF